MPEEIKKSTPTNELEHKNVSSLIWKYFWPTVFATILGTLNNFIDRIYLGQGVGTEALAGVTVIFPIMLMVVAASAIVSIGSGVIIGTKLGENNTKEAEKIFGHSIIFSIIIGFISVLLIYLFKTPLLQTFGISETTFKYANDYLSILMWSWGFAVLGATFTSVAKTEGNVKISMLAASTAVSLNIIFDPIFIFGFNMGVKGAAWASNLTNIFLFLWGFYHFSSHHSVIKLKYQYLRYSHKVNLNILNIGFAPFIMMLSSSLVQILTNSQLSKHGGDMAIAITGVVFAIMGMIMFLTRALGNAIQPIISYNNGAQNYDRVRTAVFLAIKYSTILTTTGLIFILIFPKFIISLFIDSNSEFLEVGSIALWISVIGLPFYGVLIVGTQYFTAMKYSKRSTFLSLIQPVIIYIPLLYLLSQLMGLNGIWLAYSSSIILASIVVSYFVYKEMYRLKNETTTLRKNYE